MATQKISVEAFRLLCAECADSLASSDYKTAWSKYAQAQAVLSGLLTISTSSGQDSVSWIQSLRELGDAIKIASQTGVDSDDSRFIKTSVGYRG